MKKKLVLLFSAAIVIGCMSLPAMAGIYANLSLALQKVKMEHLGVKYHIQLIVLSPNIVSNILVG